MMQLWTPDEKRLIRPRRRHECAPLGFGLSFARPPKILGSTFLPTSIPGLKAWYRADLGTTIATGVSQWNDQSGNGVTLTQATGSKQPPLIASNASYNNQSTLRFTAAAQSGLVQAAFALAQPYTVFVVGNYDGSATTQYFLCSNATTVEALTNNSTTNVNIYSGTGRVASGLADTASPQVMAATFNGAASSIYVNAKTPKATGNPGSNAFTDIAVGWFAAGGNGLIGDIAEICIFNSVLSAGNINSMLAYFGGRYAITIGP